MSCLLWFLSNFISAISIFHNFYLARYVPTYEVYNYPLFSNLAYRQLLGYSGVLNSIFNPFLLIVILQNYRKPFKKLLEKIRLKLKNTESVQAS